MTKKSAGRNPLVELLGYGQSIWYDNISRELLQSGELERMVAEDGLRGVTSNPTIFEKAITGSGVYTEEIRSLRSRGKTTEEIYEALAIEDIRAAADRLLPVWEESGGGDGYVSLEVSPTLAYDAEGTVRDAIRLHRAVDRRNLMIKIPGTAEGLPAIEQATAAGISVNVTLIFALKHYLGVAEAYLRGLEALERDGGRLDGVASVASVFVSRLDTSVDKILGPNREAWEYLGRAGIANAKVIYGTFREIFSTPRFKRLEEKGARAQRPLWASTGVKNPRYSDVLYVEELIGPQTVNTVPPATLAAFRDHGVPAARLERDLESAPWFLQELSQFGIDLEAITDELQVDAVKSFASSFEQLMKGIEGQAASTTAAPAASVERYRPWLNEAWQMMDDRRLVARLWEKDPTLWHHQPSHHAIIRSSLGWLGVPGGMLARDDELQMFANEVREAGFDRVALLGIGGSTAAAEVVRDTFGVAEGFPDLIVIDSTVPAAITRAERRLDPARTLFLVSSKSGSTTETVFLQRYFHEKVRAVRGDRAGEHFVAITDLGTSLERLAREQGFRRVFPSFRDVTGRFGALTPIGMLPAALVGADVTALLESAARMAERCGPAVPARENPGAQLGAILGELSHLGRDKVTLVVSPRLSATGAWIEQLVSESTGKEGRGLLVVDGEDLGAPAVYGRDRAFVSLELSDGDAGTREGLATLEAAGHPVVRIPLEDPVGLGGEFFRWQVATALAAALLGLDPFDQPDVQEAKDATRALISRVRGRSKLPKARPDSLGKLPGFLKGAREFDYVAILAFLDARPEIRSRLQRLRMRVRDRTRLATTVGFGPRYLHSTGQFHKGGRNEGLFVLVTGSDGDDVAIPGEPFGFEVLKQAQALGDLQALRALNRRVIHLDLGTEVENGLERMIEAIG